jgi:hypothetical protein
LSKLHFFHFTSYDFRVFYCPNIPANRSPQIPVDAPAKGQAKKGPGRPRKIKADSEGGEGDALAAPSTPKTPAKRGRQAKPKTPQTTIDGSEVPPTAPKSSVKRGAAEVGNETPSKKPKATPKTPAAAKVGFPTCWEEFADEDKMIVNMRRDKVAWPEIEAEWEKMTGSKPGKDVLRKKYAKLEAVATIFAPGDVIIRPYSFLDSLANISSTDCPPCCCQASR